MIPMALDDFEGFLDASLEKIKHDPTMSWNLSFIFFMWKLFNGFAFKSSRLLD